MLRAQGGLVSSRSVSDAATIAAEPLRRDDLPQFVVRVLASRWAAYTPRRWGQRHKLDMLPTGVSAYGASSPGCNGPLTMSVSSWPQARNRAFSLTCNNAPPSSLCVVLLGTAALSSPFRFLGVDLWVNPAGLLFRAFTTASNQVGAGDFVLPLPGGSAGAQLTAQFVWFGPSSPAPCPPGAFSASNALAITIQP